MFVSQPLMYVNQLSIPEIHIRTTTTTTVSLTSVDLTHPRPSSFNNEERAIHPRSRINASRVPLYAENYFDPTVLLSRIPLIHKSLFIASQLFSAPSRTIRLRPAAVTIG